MDESSEIRDADPARSALPVTLIAAVVQGWALYWLHRAVEDHLWLSTQKGCLVGLYALAVFVPSTVELMAAHARRVAFWMLLAGFAIVYFWLGWQQGATVLAAGDSGFNLAKDCLGFLFTASVLWLMLLPFAQRRLETGRWRGAYPLLFASAWQNHLALAEASLFTGLFWLILFLWQMLFHLLGIDFFRELFEKPIFAYPVTALAFGCALHLIGSIERLTSVLLTQLLNVLKWLMPVAAILVVCFTIALAARLPTLLVDGEKAIGASWLLWLAAICTLLLNAAYRDGTNPLPYPRVVAVMVRAMVPLMLVISLTALYSLARRTQYYGLTTDRFWAFVVGGAALAYSAGYSWAAVRKGAWLAWASTVNVWVALILMAVIAVALTPVLSPYRLSANSQYARILAHRGHGATDDDWLADGARDSYAYLRHRSGEYGMERLRELAAKSDAGAEFALDDREYSPDRQDMRMIASKVPVFPAGRMMEPALVDKLTFDLERRDNGFLWQWIGDRYAGLFIGLRGDDSEQFVFLANHRGLVYEKSNGEWRVLGSLELERPAMVSCPFDPRGQAAQGKITAVHTQRDALVVGGVTLDLVPQRGGGPANCDAH